MYFFQIFGFYFLHINFTQKKNSVQDPDPDLNPLDLQDFGFLNSESGTICESTNLDSTKTAKKKILYS